MKNTNTTTYNGLGASPTTMVTNGASRPRQAVGDIPAPPSNGERIPRASAAAAGNNGNTAGRPIPPKVTVRREEVEMRYDAYVWVDFLRKYWVLFVVGNLLSTAVVLFEISRVDDCFDDVTERRAGATTENIERNTEASLRFVVIAILVFGLVTELVSGVVLCFVYGSPLDIKSLRKIPPRHVPTVEAAVVVNLVAPFSWGVIFTCGSFVSLQVDSFSSCGGPDGPVLDMYLIVSGWGMLLIGLGMIGLAGFLTIFMFSCRSPSPNGSTEECCTADKVMYGHRILSKAAILDVFWQLQGSVWLYRTGSVSGFAFVVLIVLGIVGGLMAALGSRAPPSTAHDLPSSPLVLGQPPEAADGA